MFSGDIDVGKLLVVFFFDQARSDYVSEDKAKETFIETTRALGRALPSDCKLSRFQNFVNFCLRHACSWESGYFL